MRSVLAFLLLPCVACSSSSSGASSGDGGPDATSDAADGGCFPFCGSSGDDASDGTDSGDASLTCAQLKNQVAALQTPAQACDPKLENQCNGTAQGVCCPITVTGGNDQAVGNFQQAVDLYKEQCDASCIAIVCPVTPSFQCEGTTATQGGCK